MIRMVRFLPVILFFQFASAQIQLSVADLNATAGSDIVLPITISEGGEIVAIQFDVDFDSALLSLPEGSLVLPGNAVRDHSVGSSTQPGKLTVLIVSSSLSTLEAGPGTLVQLVLRVSPEAAADATTQVTLSQVQASDGEGNPLGVFSDPGTITISQAFNSPAQGQNRLVFPQIANGSFNGGSFAVTMIFVNRTRAISSGRLALFKSDGTAFDVTLKDGSAGSSFDFDVPAGGSVFFETDGSGDLSPGYAVLDATAPLGGALLFTSRDAGQVALTETGVGSSPSGDKFSIPLIFMKGVTNTGIALANPSSQSPVITLVLRDREGIEVGRTDIPLEPGGHLPRFSNELFDELSDVETFRGSIEIESSAPINAIALKQQGSLLTTFPVVILN